MHGIPLIKFKCVSDVPRQLRRSVDQRRRRREIRRKNNSEGSCVSLCHEQIAIGFILITLHSMSCGSSHFALATLSLFDAKFLCSQLFFFFFCTSNNAFPVLDTERLNNPVLEKCTRFSEVTFHGSWIAGISVLKSPSSMLSVSDTKPFQSVFGCANAKSNAAAKAGRVCPTTVSGGVSHHLHNRKLT